MNYTKINIPMKQGADEGFLLEIPENEMLRFILYVPLRGYVAEITKECYDYIKQDKNTVIDIFAKILEKKEKIDIIRLHKISKAVLPTLTISLTDVCNLRCKYCFFSAGYNDSEQTMSTDTAVEIIDAYFDEINNRLAKSVRNDDNTINISFAGGGEQTCAFKLLCFAVDYIKTKARQLKLIPRFEMPTNGVFNDEVREYIASEIHSISLSLDGTEHIQNYHRPRICGGSSYEEAIKTAQFLYAHDSNFAIRMTVSNYSLPFVCDVIDEFASEFPGIAPGIEPLTLSGRAKLKVGGLSKPNETEFAELLSKVFKESDLKGYKIKNSAIAKLGLPRTVFCSNVANPNWVVSTSGGIYACTHTHENMKFGDFNFSAHEVVFDEDKIACINKMDVFNYRMCEDCFCKYTCAGDCADRHLEKQFRCKINRKVTSDDILRALTK